MRGPPRIDPEAVHAAELFATHASIALGHAQQEHHLNQALASRKVIGQAIGIWNSRVRCVPGPASPSPSGVDHAPAQGPPLRTHCP